jgi:hypothetical protein
VRVLFVLLLTTRVAFAQAPGEAPAAPAAPAARTVMANRWAVALDLGSIGLTPKTSGADTTSFGMLELSGRFRIRPAIEVGLMVFGGGSAGNLSTSGLFADFRYRFLADRPWNVYALAGFGVVSAADKMDSSTETKGRGAVRIGGGVERRFEHFALQAELRFVAVAQNRDVEATDSVTTQAYLLERYGLGGGSLSIGASYYF